MGKFILLLRFVSKLRVLGFKQYRTRFAAEV
jgi:hypothetical protein